MNLEVTSEALTAMRQAAGVAHPHEACGMLLGECGRITSAVPTANIHPYPATHFEIDPQALIDAHRAARQAGALQVIGYFHSHPRGPAAPSATDRACAAGDGKVWAIIAGADIGFWMDRKQGFAALSYTVVVP